jgi:hypothetical protein
MLASAVRVLPHGVVVSALAPPNQSQRRGFFVTMVCVFRFGYCADAVRPTRAR